MINNQILDIAIGLIFIYLFLSLFAAVIQEVLAGYWDQRGKFLRKCISSMLKLPKKKEDIPGSMFEDELTNQFYLHPLINKFNTDATKSDPAYLEAESFSKILVEVLGRRGQAALQKKAIDAGKSLSLGKEIAERIEHFLFELSQSNSNTLPGNPYPHFLQFKFVLDQVATKTDAENAIIDPENRVQIESIFNKLWEKFSANSEALTLRIEAASPPISFTNVTLENIKAGIASLPNAAAKGKRVQNAEEAFQNTRTLLLSMVGPTVEITRNNLEVWYNHAMDRFSGIYKTQAVKSLFLIGFTLCLIFNADTIAIIRHLSINDKARNALLEIAEARSKQEFEKLGKSNETSGNLTELERQALNENIRIDNLNAVFPAAGLGWNKRSVTPYWDGSGISGYLIWGMLKLIGILLTALAILLKGPFWFDLLNKFINIRNTGRKPAPSEDGSGAGAGAAGNSRHKPAWQDRNVQ